MTRIFTTKAQRTQRFLIREIREIRVQKSPMKKPPTFTGQRQSTDENQIKKTMKNTKTYAKYTESSQHRGP
jgi:hypothetical protein